MAHVGIHRFATSHREKGRAEDREADVEILVQQEIEGIKRADGGEHAGRLHDAVDAKQRDCQEPGQHHRPENPADEAGALFLNDEEPDQDDDGQRHHRGGERGRIDFQALDR
jgi:hypothetical protein